jgi:hypothetical protein
MCHSERSEESLLSPENYREKYRFFGASRLRMTFKQAVAEKEKDDGLVSGESIGTQFRF